MAAGSEPTADMIAPRAKAIDWSHSGGLTIGADRRSGRLQAFAVQPSGAASSGYQDPAAPSQPHAQFLAARNQQRVKLQAADADAATTREVCRRLV